MRQWMIKPNLLCDKHLGGEYVEGLMLLGSIAKGISMKGYVKNGLVEVHNIRSRWDEVKVECLARGRKAVAIPKEPKLWHEGKVDTDESIRELKHRCPNCKVRLENAGY